MNTNPFDVGDIVRVSHNWAYKYSSITSNDRVEVTEIINSRKFRGTPLSGYSKGQSYEYISDRFVIERKADVNDDIPLSERRIITHKGKLSRLTVVSKVDELLAELHRQNPEANYLVWKPEFESYVEAPPVKRRAIES